MPAPVNLQSSMSVKSSSEAFGRSSSGDAFSDFNSGDFIVGGSKNDIVVPIMMGVGLIVLAKVLKLI